MRIEKERFTELCECDNTMPPLGSGAQGVVSLCTVKKMGEAVVCKVVKANTRVLLHGARREADVHPKCSSHPLVATVCNTMEFHGGMHMVVMDYCACGNLADLIDYSSIIAGGLNYKSCRARCSRNSPST